MAFIYGPFVALCSNCQKPSLATVRGSITEPVDENGPAQILHLTSCQDCGRGLLIAQGIEEGPDGEEITAPVVAWPSPAGSVGARVPAALRREYEQARVCYQAQAYTAVAVMVRRTLEGVCAEEGVKRRTLGQSLSALQEEGKIDQRLVDWAAELRVLGNEGAHYTGSQVSLEDARDALHLAQAFLDYMYTFSTQFEEFKKRRAQRHQRNN
ncbi:DUF4145 domain-containing protein [Streptomyces sp. ME02-6991-2A]|uniref:DUF4145 domain-containing protein n=1 Tax=Streptomyces sp. ME02-6991-2A TaxID=3028677 RepID=UPI0029A8B34A|nr:DUF4145 domain-containing protein [Streptomyces sp. ME02-6991-2A]MDX3377734.1 DUF4145 domain-containing protein [Streptomyces sp. ME02-6991-2A]